MAGGQAVRYWVVRDLRRRARAAIVLAALTFIAAVVPLVAAAGARRTATSFERMDAELEPVHLNVQFEENAPPDDVLERLAAVPGVAHAAEGASILARPVGLDRPPFESFGQGPRRGGVITDFDRPRLVAGRFPRAAGEALVSRELARELSLRPGSTFTIETFSPDSIERIFSGEQVGYDGPEVELRVTAIGDQPESITGGASSESAPMAPLFVVPESFFERWDETVHFFDGIFLMRLEEGIGIDVTVARLREEFADRDDMTIYPSELASRVEESVAAQATALGLLAAVALFGGMVVVVQAARRFARSGEDDEAVGRAIGFTQADVVRSRVLASAAPVVAGLLVAIAVAVAASGAYPRGVAGRMEPAPGIRPDVLVHAALAGLLLLATITGVVLLGRGGQRVAGQSAAAARPMPLSSPGPAVLVGLRSLSSRVPRRPSAAHSAMVACTAGLAGLVGALVFGHSLDRFVTEPARFGWNWDLSVSLGDNFTDEAAEERGARVVEEGVEEAMLARLASRSFDGRTVTSVGTKPLKGDVNLTVVRGREVRRDGEVVFGAKTLRLLGKDIGDRVEAAGPEGPVPLVIVGQALFPVEENDDPTQGAGVTLATIGKLEGPGGFPNVYLSLLPGVSRSEFEEAVAEEVASVSGLVRPGLVVNLDTVDQTPYLLAGYLGVLAAAATVHALLSAIRRRRREFSVLKVIGFVRRQVAQAVLVEGVAVVVVGLLVGFPAGLLLGRAVWSLAAGRIGVAADATSPALVLALIVPATFALAAAVSLVPAAMAGRTHPAAALREE